jgi:hypothetical protein
MPQSPAEPRRAPQSPAESRRVPAEPRRVPQSHAESRRVPAWGTHSPQSLADRFIQRQSKAAEGHRLYDYTEPYRDLHSCFFAYSSEPVACSPCVTHIAAFFAQKSQQNATLNITPYYRFPLTYPARPFFSGATSGACPSSFL